MWSDAARAGMAFHFVRRQDTFFLKEQNSKYRKVQYDNEREARNPRDVIKISEKQHPTRNY